MESHYVKINDPSDELKDAQLKVFDALDEVFSGPNMLHHMNVTINECPETEFQCLVCGAKWNIYSPKQGKAAHKDGCLAIKLWEAYDEYVSLLKSKDLPHSHLY